MTVTWDGVLIDTTLLSDYGYRDPITVDSASWPRYLGYVAAGISQLGANITTALAGGTAPFIDASSTSDTIALGASTLVVSPSRGFRAGMVVLAYADATHWQCGTVTSYDLVTGVLVLNVTSTGGAGTFAAWTVTLSGVTGMQGIQGIQGVQGLQGIQGAGGSGSTISAQQDGVPVTSTARANINATASVVAVDDAGGNRIGLALKGDTATPGATKLYGTDGSGVKGWQSFPATVVPPDPLYLMGLTF